MVKMKFINTVLAAYRKNRCIINHVYPWSVIMARVMGSLFVLIFQYFLYNNVFSGNVSAEFINYTGTEDYLTYVILGDSLNILCFSTMINVGRVLVKEIREGTIENLYLSPASRIGYFVGSYVEQFMRSIYEFGIIILIGMFLGTKNNFTMLPSIILIIILATISFFTIALLLSAIMIFTRDTFIAQNTLYTLMSLVCGISFPIELLPKYVRWISQIFPLTQAVNLYRNCILNNQSIIENINELIKMLLLSLMYFIIAMLWMKKMEKKIIEEVYA